MRFPMPNYPCDFELPDTWLTEAGLADFKPEGPAYKSMPGTLLVPLQEIEPPYRVSSCIKDWCGFDHARLVRVLQGIVAGDVIEPVPLRELHEVGGSRPYRYRVCDGYHRFYGSIAAGFQSLPAIVHS